MSAVTFLPAPGRVETADSQVNRTVNEQQASMSVDLSYPPRENGNGTNTASSNAASPWAVIRKLFDKSKNLGTGESSGQQAKIIACYFQAMMTGWNGEQT